MLADGVSCPLRGAQPEVWAWTSFRDAPATRLPVVAAGWAHLRLRRIALPFGEDSLPPGFSLRAQTDGTFELAWSNQYGPRSARFHSGSAGSRDAVQLAHYVHASEVDLIRAVLDPHSLPLIRIN